MAYPSIKFARNEVLIIVAYLKKITYFDIKLLNPFFLNQTINKPTSSVSPRLNNFFVQFKKPLVVVGSFLTKKKPTQRYSSGRAVQIIKTERNEEAD